MQYKYVFSRRALGKIRSFYGNVAKKYRHTYSYEDMERNVRDATLSIYGIEACLVRREPTIARWQGLHMANTDRWYYAYRIEGDTIIVVDACHAQNMHD
jgi:hypothetical protein